MCQRGGDGPGACAEIGADKRPVRGQDLKCAFDEQFRVWARDQRLRVDHQLQAPKLALAEDVGDGFALGTARDQLAKACRLCWLQGPLWPGDEPGAGGAGSLAQQHFGVESSGFTIAGGQGRDGLAQGLGERLHSGRHSQTVIRAAS